MRRWGRRGRIRRWRRCRWSCKRWTIVQSSRINRKIRNIQQMSRRGDRIESSWKIHSNAPVNITSNHPKFRQGGGEIEFGDIFEGWFKAVLNHGDVWKFITMSNGVRSSSQLILVRINHNLLILTKKIINRNVAVVWIFCRVE